MKAYLINNDILDKNTLSYTEYCSLLALHENFDFQIEQNILESLEDKKFIKLNRNIITIRAKGINFLSAVKKDIDFVGNKIEIIKKRTDREINEQVKDRINEYRSIFKGYKTGSMGSLSGCKENLTKFLKDNPEYTFEDVLKAARIYVNSVDNLKYLQRADYFIYKQQRDKTTISTLEAYIDESEDKSEEDWTSQLN